MGIGHRFGWQHDNGFQHGTDNEREPLREAMNPTVHRAEKTDDPKRFKSIFKTLEPIAQSGLPVIFP